MSELGFIGVGETQPEDRKGIFRGEVVYILDHHPLPLAFAMVYLMDRRKFPTPESTVFYLQELDKQQAWEEPNADTKKTEAVEQITKLARPVGFDQN